MHKPIAMATCTPRISFPFPHLDQLRCATYVKRKTLYGSQQRTAPSHNLEMTMTLTTKAAIDAGLAAMLANPHVTEYRLRDPQYGAAIWLLARIGPGTAKFFCDEGIEIAALLEVSGAWSHGEQVMVRIALDLFFPGCVEANDHPPAGWGEAAGVLDTSNMQRVYGAIRIARGETDIARLLAERAPAAGHSA